VGAYPEHYLTTDKKGLYDPANIAIVDVDGTRALELRVVSGRTNGTGKPSGATPEARLLGPKRDGYTTGERIEMRPGSTDRDRVDISFSRVGWPRGDDNWPKNGEPDYVESGTAGDHAGRAADRDREVGRRQRR
jgi:hypothetical protein